MYVVHPLDSLFFSLLLFFLSLNNGSSLQRPLIGPLQERLHAAAAATADNASQARRRHRLRRPSLSARPTLRQSLRFRPRANGVRDLRRRVPHLLRQASQFRCQPHLHQFAESELSELARAPAIHNLHSRQQGQEGLRSEISRFGLQKEPWLRFGPGKAQAPSHRRRTHAQPDEGFRSHGFARSTRAAQDFRWPGRYTLRLNHSSRFSHVLQCMLRVTLDLALPAFFFEFYLLIAFRWGFKFEVLSESLILQEIADKRGRNGCGRWEFKILWSAIGLSQFLTWLLLWSKYN